MSDAIKHECGIAMVRLLKPLSFIRKIWGDALWGLNKLYLLMEKQHNRGQEGAGIAAVKLDVKPGEEYIFRERGRRPVQFRRFLQPLTRQWWIFEGWNRRLLRRISHLLR